MPWFISQLFLISTSTVSTFMFTKMKHPMSMGILLLTQTVIICLMTSGISQNSWFSYILFLVFLGGMLVLFIYMTSVASNEMFLSSSMILMMPFMMAIIMISLFIFIDPLLMNNHSEDILMNQVEKSNLPTTSMFTYPNNILTVTAVLYLFLTLIVVVKITEFNKGPLRSKT